MTCIFRARADDPPDTTRMDPMADRKDPTVMESDSEEPPAEKPQCELGDFVLADEAVDRC